MGVKPGYKQTEVGLIPKEWTVMTIGQFATIKTGPFGTLLKASEYSTDGVPLISVGEIREGFLRITDDTPRVSEAVTRRLPQYLLRRGDIVFGRKGAVDRSALIREGQDGWFLGSDGIGIRPTQDCHNEYLGFQFQTARIQGWLLQHAIGTTMPSLNQNVLRNVLVPIPSTKAEQEAIAEALRDADALIESVERLIAKKRKIKQGAMQELLSGSKRLPGFNGEWQQRKLCELGESLIGLTYKPSNVKSDGLLVLRSSNIFQEALRFEDNVFVDMDVPAAIILRKGDILICVRNGSRDLIGKCALINEEAQGMTFGAFMAVFRTPFYKFVYHQFQSDLIKRQINEHLGATINQITNKSLNSFQIPFPTNEDERTAIAVILSDMDVEITTLEAKLGKARELKLGMMQDLLTGKVRLV